MVSKFNGVPFLCARIVNLYNRNIYNRDNGIPGANTLARAINPVIPIIYQSIYKTFIQISNPGAEEGDAIKP